MGGANATLPDPAGSLPLSKIAKSLPQNCEHLLVSGAAHKRTASEQFCSVSDFARPLRWRPWWCCGQTIRAWGRKM